MKSCGLSLTSNSDDGDNDNDDDDKNKEKDPNNTIRIRHDCTSSHLILPISKQTVHLYFLLLFTDPTSTATLQEFTVGSYMNFFARTHSLHVEVWYLVPIFPLYRTLFKRH